MSATLNQIAAANRAIAAAPHKHRARLDVRNALRRGELARGACSVGGDCKGDLQCHHPDYRRPLDVVWLCRRHHRLAHLADARAAA